MILKLTDIRKLYQLSKNRSNSEYDYYLFQELMGDLLIRYLQSKKIDIDGKNVLDLGCGYGGYSKALKKNSADVIGLDFNPYHSKDELSMIKGDALFTPFPDNSFDIIICTSLIEHVADPQSLLMEIHRILKSGCFFILSFPPFYTPIGGHQFAPYHLLGEKVAIRIKKFLTRGKKLLNENSEVVSFNNAFEGWGLYPLSIRKVDRLLSKESFFIIERSTRWSSVDVSWIPILGEFITWHVQYLVKKI